MNVISSHCSLHLVLPETTVGRSGLIFIFFFCEKKKNRSENCQNHCRSAGVTSISFPSIHRERRNKERPPIQVMKFIPWMHGSEVQLIDSVSWQKLSNLNEQTDKKNHLNKSCELLRTSELRRVLFDRVEITGSGNVRMKCHYVVGEASKWDVKVTVSFCPCEREKTQTGTNGCNQVDEHRTMSFHFPLWTLTVRFLQKNNVKIKKSWFCTGGMSKPFLPFFWEHQPNIKGEIRRAGHKIWTIVVLGCARARVRKSVFNLSRCLIHSLHFTPDSSFNFKCSALQNGFAGKAREPLACVIFK